MDEGLPIAYQVLEKGVPVLASDGEQVGTVATRAERPEKDVFHGLLINTPGHGIRFVEAADIAIDPRTRRRSADRRGGGSEPARARARSAGVRRGPGQADEVEPLGAQADARATTGITSPERSGSAGGGGTIER